MKWEMFVANGINSSFRAKRVSVADRKTDVEYK